MPQEQVQYLIEKRKQLTRIERYENLIKRYLAENQSQRCRYAYVAEDSFHSRRDVSTVQFAKDSSEPKPQF